MPITLRSCRNALLCSVLASSRVFAQIENPVYIDDSPQAWELFRQAQDQTRNNVGEAVRIYQELLDEFALKLIPIGENQPDQFTAVRRRVVDVLGNDPNLLERYRIIQKSLADQLLEAGELERLALTRSLTESGLEALLRLAQRDLESGRFSSALTWLAQAQTHPDLTGRRAMHCLYMLAVANHYLHQDARAASAADQLATLGTEASPCLQQLRSILGGDHALAPPAAGADRSSSTLDQGNASDLNDLVAQAIWSVPLEDSLVHRRYAAAQDDPFGVPANSVFESARSGRDADLTTVAPAVLGDAVYINEGHTILAFNRLTGRQLWKYDNLGPLSLNERDLGGTGIAQDLNIVAATTTSGGALVTLTGYAQTTGRSESGRVICVESETGKLRWSAPLEGIVDAPTNEQLFPLGAPLIEDGRVFILARRLSMQSITSEYVIALDLDDNGKVLWVRYVTSSGGLRAGIRPVSTLAMRDGALYVASTVGAVARIESTTGEIRWLTRFTTPMSASLSEQSRRPWEMNGPVVTRRGVLAIQPDQRRVVLLDLETGSQLESHALNSVDDWNQPRYLLADDSHVYAIGSEIRAFDLEDLSTPLWRVPALEQSKAPAKAPDAEPTRKPVEPKTISSLELRGRVQLVNGALVVPASDSMLVVDADTGNLRKQLAIATGGNPMATESQLLVASSDQLSSYMSFSKAERMLRDRIAQSPAEPEPALSLLRLGMRVNNLDLALESAQLASAAIERIPPSAAGTNSSATDANGELNALLLEMAKSEMASVPAQGEMIYAALNTAALEKPQRVEYLLSYGDWLADHALDRAVETYQTVLSDPSLANSWRVEQGVMRRASSWAIGRLSQLVQLRGPAVYAAQSDFASIRLRQLTASPNPSKEDLLAIAAEFPLADAAIDAVLRATNIALQQNDSRGALAMLINAYRTAPRPEATVRLLGKFVSICAKNGWGDQVEAAMRWAAESGSDVKLLTDEGSVSTAAWLDSLNTSQASAGWRLPEIGEPGQESRELGGVAIPPYRSMGRLSREQTNMRLPVDRVLISEGNTVRLLRSSDLASAWTATISAGAGGAAESPQLLHFTDRHIVLWYGADAQDPKAVMLDAGNGKVLWTSRRIAETLADAVRDLSRNRGIRDQMPNGEAFDPMQTLPLVGAGNLICVQRTGGVIALSLEDGKTISWVKKSAACGLDQVHVVAVHDAALVLAGMVRSVTGGMGGTGGELVPRIVVLDPRTGARLFEESAVLENPGRGGVKWLRVSQMGLMVFGTAEGVTAFDLYSGKRIWSVANDAVVESQRAWLVKDRLIVEDQRSRLRAVSLDDGAVSDAFELPLRGEWDPLELRGVLASGGRGEQLIAHYPQRVVMYNAMSGSILGADVITDDRDYRFLVAAKDKMIVVNSRAAQVGMADQPGRRSQQWVYGLYILSENCKVLGSPLELRPIGERVLNATAIDGWLLLSTDSQTLAVPMPRK